MHNLLVGAAAAAVMVFGFGGLVVFLLKGPRQ